MNNKAELMLHPKKNYRIISKKYTIGSVKLHWHDFYEIELAVSGSGIHIINGKEYEWKTGEVHLMRLSDYHEIKLDNPGIVHLIQIQNCGMPDSVLRVIRSVPDKLNLVTYLSTKDFAYMNMLCTMLEEQTAKQEDYNERLTGSIIRTIFNMFFDAIDINSGEKSNISESEDDQISKILNYINDNFREDIRLEDIADKFYISKSHLCTLFKKNMGETVLKYIKDTRLEYAAKLAVTTDIKSIEICETCGYGSVSNFLRDFKKRYGMSPMEMRKG